MLCFYYKIIKLLIQNGSLIWRSKTNHLQIVTKLKSLQRLVLLSATGVKSITFTADMKTLLNVTIAPSGALKL